MESALPAGMNAKSRAMLLSRVWEATLSGEQPPIAPRRIVSESWARVRRMGVDPDRGINRPPLSRDEVERRRQESGIAPVLDILRHGLTSLADDGVHIMVITDADGHLLWREGSKAVRHGAESLGFAEGARWDESTVGTNGIGTALVTGRPLQIFAAEHFVQSHHPWICTAAPIRDPVDERLMGIVDVAGPAATAHPSTLALVDSVTRLVNASLREAHDDSLAQLRCVAGPMLARLSGPALVIDRHGWVAAAAGVWPGKRVLVPETVDGDLAYVPSVGLCRIEPLFGGWLLRPDAIGQEQPTKVVLNLREQTPSISVVTPSGTWLHRLRPRHAEMLLVLALRREGRSASDLSTELFGDPHHTVAVRAELSRLRGILGSLIDRRPYRFSPHLEVACELPNDLAALLPQSSAAIVGTLRASCKAK